MRIKLVSILFVAALIVGCKSADTAASTTPDATKASSTDATKTADNSAPKDDATKPTDAAPDTAKDIVGTWTSDNPELKDDVAEVKDDGTMKETGTSKEGISVEAEFSYKIDGDKVTRTMTGGKMTAPETADAKTKSLAEEANKMSNSPEELKKMPPHVGTITWKDKDHFTIKTDDGKTMNYTRKS